MPDQSIDLNLFEDSRSALIRQWMEAFGQTTPTRPIVPDVETRKLRVRLIAEELLELCAAFQVTLSIRPKTSDEYECAIEAWNNPEEDCDLVEVADALSDLDVVVTGTHVACGLPQELLLAENMRANFSKLGADGQPIYRPDGKVMKGPAYAPPDFGAVLHRLQQDPPEPISRPDEPLGEAPVPPIEKARRRLAHTHLAVTEVGDALAKLGILLAQGKHEDGTVRGDVVRLLTAAAYRVQHGEAPEYEAPMS